MDSDLSDSIPDSESRGPAVLKPLFGDLPRVLEALETGVPLLTPNRRLSRAVLHAYAEHQRRQGRQAWETPTVLPQRQFWLSLWERAVTRGLLPPAQHLDVPGQRDVWRRVISDDLSRSGFSLISPERAAALCQQAQERLLLWRTDTTSAALRQQFSFTPDTAAFLRWQRLFEEELARLSLRMPEQSLSALLACVDTLTGPVRALYPEMQAPLYDALLDSVPASQRLPRGAPEPGADTLHRFADERSELRAIARWCRTRAQSDPSGRYAVVLPDMGAPRDVLEILLRREFDCLTRNYDSLPVNFATGFELERVPLVRDALRVLSLAREQLAVADLVAVLHSRFVKPLPLSDERLEAFVWAVHDLGRAELPQSVLRQLFDQHVARDSDPLPWDRLRHLDSQGRLQQQRQLPSGWAALFRQVLEAWGWPSYQPLDSLEFQQLEQFHQALDTFSSRDLLGGRMGLAEALHAFRELLRETLFQPRTRDAAVQVLGRLEATGLHFDGLWVAGMRADSWPDRARPNPYLPVPLQREQRMPHADSRWEDAWSQQLWRHWRAGSERLICSYVAEEDGVEMQASPLLAGMDASAPEIPETTPQAWIEQADSALFMPVPLAALPLGDKERAAGGVGGYALEQQSRCPFQGFAAQRLAATPLAPTLAGLSAGERGSMLHRALYRLYGDIPGREQLREMDLQTRRQCIERAAAEAPEAVNALRRIVLGPAVLAVEERRIAAVLLDWLQVDEQRGDDWLVAERELRREFSLQGLTLKMRLDRVDEVAGGGRMIIDYKSGAAESLQRWFGPRPERPQLPLYALSEPRAAGIAYASLKPAALAYRGIAENPASEGIEDPQRWSGGDGDVDGAGFAVLREHWERELGELAREFLAGVADVDPVGDACRYCARHALCRIGELSR